jgi:hypothetical protein
MGMPIERVFKQPQINVPGPDLKSAVESVLPRKLKGTPANLIGNMQLQQMSEMKLGN